MCRSYTIYMLEEAPNWDEIPVAGIDQALWLPNPGIHAWAQVCCFDEALHVRLFAREQSPLARFTGLYDMVCLDSCLEFFLCPLRNDSRYFHFEFNPNGALYLGFGHGREDGVRQIVQDGDVLFCVQKFMENDNWGISFRIPFSFIRLYMPEFSIRNGLRMSGNFYKCGDETQTPHYLAWNRVKSLSPDFHRTEDFGTLLIFEVSPKEQSTLREKKSMF